MAASCCKFADMNTMTTFTTSIRDYVTALLGGDGHTALIAAILFAVTAIGAVCTYYLAKWVLKLLERAVLRSSTTWDDDLLAGSMLGAIAQLAPALAVNAVLPAFFSASPTLNMWLSKITSFYILWAVVRIVCIFLSNLYAALAKRPNTKAYAIKGIFQMLRLIFIGIGVIVGLSILIDKQPTTILTAIGASAAVLMLVFKDTILGLVASIQLSANKMVHRGDWIVVRSRNIDGEVIDVSLTTVKVRNWDNSISTIPPYSLISDSFHNYQAMRDAGGRRIDRSILIDVNTVRFLSPEEIQALQADGLVDAADVAEASHVVNLTLLRRYLERFLAGDERVNHDMIYMVRQMAPTTEGVPLQLYFFTMIIEWKSFEGVQSDIMDYVYAIVNRFGLSMFQSPAGRDIKALTGQ